MRHVWRDKWSDVIDQYNHCGQRTQGRGFAKIVSSYPQLKLRQIQNDEDKITMLSFHTMYIPCTRARYLYADFLALR